MQVFFVLLLGAVAVVAWGTKSAGRTAKVQAALGNLDSYDARAFRQAELAQPASQRLLKPALGADGGGFEGDHAGRPHPQAGDQGGAGGSSLEPRRERATCRQTDVVSPAAC